MARRRVVVLPAAELEARSAFWWYFERNPDAASRFEDELTSSIVEISDGPEQYAEIEDGIRRALLRHFPYGVLYSLEGTRSSCWP